MITDLPILIIGAGMAGLAAASHLQRSGVRAVVLEARDRIGGRVHCDHSLEAPIDLGGSWIHGPVGNPVAALATALGERFIHTHPGQNELYRSDGSRFPPELLAEAIGRFQKRHEESYHLKIDADRPVADAFRDLWGPESPLEPEGRRVIRWRLIRLEASYGADLSVLSLKHWNDDIDYPGGDWLLTRGYGPIVEHLAAGLDVRLEQPVQRIEVRPDGVVVQGTWGALTADRVLVTVPLGVLKAGDIAFDPPLSDARQQAIDSLKMGLLDKVALRFDRPFWPVGEHRLGFEPQEDGDVTQFINMLPFVGAPVLVGYIGASRALAFEAQTDGEIVARTLSILRRMYGDRVLEPIGFRVTRWAADPYAHGSYSFSPVGVDSEMFDRLAAPEGARLFFAGEATNREYRSTVHGAYQSGLREADRILGIYRAE